MSNRPSSLRFPVSLAVLAALLSAASFPALGKDVRVSGFGTRKCSEWQEWKAAQNGEARAMAVEWAHGFIAGHNVYARNGNEPANSVVADAKILAALLDNYCQKNPDGRILAGVIDITQSLGGAKISIAPKTQLPAPTPHLQKPDGPKAPSDV